jgi:2-keto-4-pentenoate hydratase
VAALREQLVRRRAMLANGAHHVGWKLVYETAELEELVGRDPVIGHLTTGTLIGDGARFSIAQAVSPRAETEVAIEIARDVDPGAPESELQDSIGGLGVALELVDVARPPGGAEGIIESNAFHRGFALGRSQPVRAVPSGEARLCVDGKRRAIAPLETDCVANVRSAARLLSTVGERLSAGDRILAGGLTHVPITAGCSVVAEIDGLGSVNVTLE